MPGKDKQPSHKSKKQFRDSEKDAGKDPTMDNNQQSPEDDSQAPSLAEREERRTRRREEGALSRIEDITYNVLRKHKPQP